ncbi:MAG: hypothetical protein WC073_17120, partial [Sterolibacterium sp.]
EGEWRTGCRVHQLGSPEPIEALLARHSSDPLQRVTSAGKMHPIRALELRQQICSHIPAGNNSILL